MGKEDKDVIKDLQTTLAKLQKSSQRYFEGIEGATAAALNGQKKLIKELRKEMNLMVDVDMKKQAKELLSRITDQEKAARDQLQVTGRIKNEVASIASSYVRFLRTTAAQYNLAQQIAKEYKLVARDIGLGGAGAEKMKQSFKDSLPSILEMGLTTEDAGRIYKEMAEVSGRITPVTKEDAARIAGIAGGTGLMADETTRMAESFRLMGVQSDVMSDNIMEVYKESQAMGLNATKVIKVLSQNMSTMQQYSFAGGVKGMTEMAKQAVKMRLDVGEVLTMADKFYQPEAAIEAAANLQMLGGDIAKAFGDPFETMYLARNKPEELAKKLGDMTENMMTFNEETGQYDFPAEVRMQLKAAGEQLGINTGKMIEMARQTSKIKDIQMKFTSVGDEETRENLASLAQWSEKGQKFQIEHGGEMFDLSEIGPDMADEIIKSQQTPEEDMKDIAINTQVMSEKLKSMDASMKARASLTSDIYEITAGQVEKTMLGPLKKGMDNALDAFTLTVGDNMADIIKNAGLAEEMNEEVSMLNKFATALKEDGVKTLEQYAESASVILDKWKRYTDDTLGQGGKPPKLPDNLEDEDFVSLPGGSRYFSGGKGTVKIHDDDVVVAGTSLLGKDRGESRGTGVSAVSGSIDVNFNNAVIRLESDNGNIALDMNKIKDAIQPIIINALNNKSRNGELLSSKETVDSGMVV